MHIAIPYLAVFVSFTPHATAKGSPVINYAAAAYVCVVGSDQLWKAMNGKVKRIGAWVPNNSEMLQDARTKARVSGGNASLVARISVALSASMILMILYGRLYEIGGMAYCSTELASSFWSVKAENWVLVMLVWSAAVQAADRMEGKGTSNIEF